MSGLRDRERRILGFLSSAIEERDDRISVDEIQRTLGIPDRDTVETALRKLEREGYIRTDPDAPSGFVILRGMDGSYPPRRPRLQSSTHDSSIGASLELSRPDPSGLPPRQRQTYEFIRDRILGLDPPSIPEIAAELGLASTNRVWQLLETLERKGFIRLHREPGKRRRARSIELVGYGPPEAAARSSALIPVLGQIAAGFPALAEPGHMDWLQLPRELIGRNDPDRVFVLGVKGDSMVGDSVLDGDRVVVRRQQEAADGDMVVAQVTNPITGKPDATVKRYRYQGGRAWLMPSNPNYERIDAHEAAIVGKVIGLLRFSI